MNLVLEHISRIHATLKLKCSRLTNSVAPASGGARSDWSAPVPPTSLLFMALSDSEKENFCPKVLPLKTDLGGIAGVSLILLMPPGDLQLTEERRRLYNFVGDGRVP